MRPKALIHCLFVICALGIYGCKKTANSTDSGATAGGNTPSTDSASNIPQGGPGGAAPAPGADSEASAQYGPPPVVVRRGTEIVVVADQTVSTRTNNPGDRFDASVAEPVVVGDRVVIPKGARASGTVVDAKSAGKIKGSAHLTVALSTVTVDGKKYRVKTSEVTESGKGRGKRTAEGAGGGAVVGGLIGALAGRGKGAAIGAAVGAGAGTATAAETGQRDITINSESRLSFRLEDALQIEGK